MPLSSAYVDANFKETQLDSHPARARRSTSPSTRYGGRVIRGRRRLDRAGFGRAVLAAAAGQRDGQFHQGRAARRRAHRGRAGSARRRRRCGRACPSSPPCIPATKACRSRRCSARWDLALRPRETAPSRERSRARVARARSRRAAARPSISTCAASSPSSSWCSACSWRFWTSRSSRPRCRKFRPGFRRRQDEVTWVQTSYLIAEVIMIPLSGFLSRAFSTRIVFVVSAAGFTLMSFFCSPRDLDRRDDRLARAAGLHRRRHDPDRVRLAPSRSFRAASSRSSRRSSGWSRRSRRPSGRRSAAI